MKNLLFFSDSTLGHLLPTFPIASNLRKQGYRVVYIGAEKVVNMAREMGFDTHPIFRETPKQQSLKAILSGSLDELMETLNPQLLIATAHTTLEVLATYYRHRVKTVLVWSHFPVGLRFGRSTRSPYEERAKQFALERMKDINPVEIYEMISLFQKSGSTIKELKDLVELCADFSHFITCSKELYFNRIADRSNELYLGYQHFIPRLSTDFSSDTSMAWIAEKKALKKQVIFCSLGTVSGALYQQKAFHFFNKIISWMSDPELQDYGMVLVAGALLEDLSEKVRSDNVLLQKWVPQAEVLAEVDLAIIHGGMGSLKECIFNKVPVMVHPMGRDQFENAKTIVKRQLGIKFDEAEMTKTAFLQAVEELKAPTYQAALVRMENILLHDFNLQKEVAFVEAQTNQLEPSLKS